MLMFILRIKLAVAQNQPTLSGYKLTNTTKIWTQTTWLTYSQHAVLPSLITLHLLAQISTYHVSLERSVSASEAVRLSRTGGLISLVLLLKFIATTSEFIFKSANVQFCKIQRVHRLTIQKYAFSTCKWFFLFLHHFHYHALLHVPIG